MNILVVNAGSSSLKYQLIDSVTTEVKAKGLCERIGLDGSRIEHKQLIKGTKTTYESPMKDHADAISSKLTCFFYYIFMSVMHRIKFTYYAEIRH